LIPALRGQFSSVPGCKTAPSELPTTFRSQGQIPLGACQTTNGWATVRDGPIGVWPRPAKENPSFLFYSVSATPYRLWVSFTQGRGLCDCVNLGQSPDIPPKERPAIHNVKVHEFVNFLNLFSNQAPRLGAHHVFWRVFSEAVLALGSDPSCNTFNSLAGAFHSAVCTGVRVGL